VAFQIVGETTIKTALSPEIDMDKIQFMEMFKNFGVLADQAVAAHHCWRLAIHPERKQHYHIRRQHVTFISKHGHGGSAHSQVAGGVRDATLNASCCGVADGLY